MTGRVGGARAGAPPPVAARIASSGRRRDRWIGRTGHGWPPQPTRQGWIVVILVTHLNGPEFALNPDLVERPDSTPVPVGAVGDGTKSESAESDAALIRLVR